MAHWILWRVERSQEPEMAARKTESEEHCYHEHGRFNMRLHPSKSAAGRTGKTCACHACVGCAPCA